MHYFFRKVLCKIHQLEHANLPVMCKRQPVKILTQIYTIPIPKQRYCFVSANKVQKHHSKLQVLTQK